MTTPTIASNRRYSIVACARWEERDIIEWIEYHRAIGIDHFYIYSNDDTPVTLFKVLAPYIFREKSIVTFKHWPITGQQPQIYFHFLHTFKQETEWFCFLDIDEFLVFKGTNLISDFVSKFDDQYDAIHLNWLLYGNNYFIERDEDSVLLYYTRRSKEIDHHTKVITRSSAIDASHVERTFLAGKIGFWHFLNDYGLNLSRITNAINGDIQGYTEKFPRNAIDYVRRQGVSDLMINTAYVAHFQFKSEKDFIRRARRGGFEISSTWEKIYLDGSYKKILDKFNDVEDNYLSTFWADRVGHLYNTKIPTLVPTPNLPNVALRKPSRQSSVFEGNVPSNAHLQGHGNDGFCSKTFGFHTALEDHPWWEVDLLREYIIKEIHIYNRNDGPGMAARASNIVVQLSKESEIWLDLYTNNTKQTVFGSDGSPLVIKVAEAVIGRFCRVISFSTTFLHLDEVEIYGLPIDLP